MRATTGSRRGRQGAAHRRATGARLALAGALAVAAGLAGLAARAAEEPSATVQRAVAAIENGDLEGAIALLAPLVEQGTAPVEARAMLGGLLVEVGRPAEAEVVLEPILGERAEPAVLYNAGRAALALGDEQRAEELFRASVELEPGTPAARELGLLLGRRGEWPDALRLLKPWALPRPHDVEARLAAAFAALRLERSGDAEALLAELPPEEPRVRLLSGRLLLLQGDAAGAISALRPLLGGSEVELDARRITAEAEMALGNAAAAVELLAGRAGEDPSVAVQLALARYQSGNLEGALAELQPLARRFLESGDGSELAGEVVLHHGRLLAAAGRPDEALPFLERAARVRPQDRVAWQAFGQALAAAGREDEARRALERFEEIHRAEVPSTVTTPPEGQRGRDPSAGGLRRATWLLGQGRREEALATVRQEREFAPEDLRPRLLESSILLLLERADEAFRAAEEAVAMAPESADARYQRGAAQLARGEREAAERDLRHALALAPEHTAAMNDLAVLLIVEDRRDEARRLLERVLEIRPGDEAARANLERLDGGS